MSGHTNGESPLWDALCAALALSVILLLAVVFVYGIRRYDIVTAAEEAFLRRIAGPAEVSPVSAEEGVSCILRLEALDPGEVDEVIRARRQAELEALRAQREAELRAMREQRAEEITAMRAERLEDMLSGETDLWSMFDGWVLIGDSRVVGFSYYGFLPESRVIAELGATILGVSDKLWQIRQAEPTVICLSFGANDLISYIWPTGPEYAARYRQLVELLQEEFPDAVIVVNSIPAIRESSLHTQEIYYRVPEFNEALRQMCEETGAVFVDNDTISEEHTSLYAGDGIHFDPAFYPYWGANIIETVLESEEDALFEIDESVIPEITETDVD